MRTGEWPLWEIFIRSQHGLAHKHVGSLHAPDAELAVQNARDVYTRRNEGVSIWVVKSTDIVASAPGDKEALFEPANSKVYRHPTFFPMPDEVKHTMSDPGSEANCSSTCCGSATRDVVLAQRLGEWIGHGPVLEEDIALTNVGLDLLGQGRMWLTLCGRGRGAHRGQGTHRGRARVPARRRRLSQPAAGRAAERRLRDDDGAAVLLRPVPPAAAARADAFDRSARRGNRGQGGEGSRLSRRAQHRLGDPAGRRHRRIARADAAGARRSVDVHRRDVHRGRRRAGAGRGRHRRRRARRCARPGWRGRRRCSPRRR